MNFGPQAGLLESISYELGANGIFDKFLLDRIFVYDVFPVHKGKINPHMLSMQNLRNNSDKFYDLPIVLTPGQIQPFTIGFRFQIIKLSTRQSEDEFEKWISWVNNLDLSVTYKTRQGSNIQEKQEKIKISPKIFETARSVVRSLRLG